jgi:hypothetical protein
MKSNGLTTILIGALAVCLLASAFLSLQFFFLSREARQLNGQLAHINTWNSGVQAFVMECAEYSKKNPAILPILKTIGVEPNPAAK